VNAPEHRRRAGLRLIAALLVCTPGLALAVLGEAESSVQGDQVRMAGARRQAAGLGYRVHTITLPDGSSVRQFAGADGTVFAVVWNTRFKPRLDQLLGTHFAAYAQGGREALRRTPGVKHSAVIEAGDLVVESTAHLQSHVGRAWLRSRWPAGVATDALR
jgi:hypothetical protein